MERLIAEQLIVLCWDDENGRPQRRCSSTLAPAVGGALLLDALLADVVTIEDGAVRATGEPADDPLLMAAAEEAERRWRTSKVKGVVQRLGTRERLHAVRSRLVDAGVLRADERRMLWVIPVTRHPLADQAAAMAVRDTARSLLTGLRDPDSAAVREVMLAALTKPAGAIPLLVDGRSERKAAEERAESFGEGHGVPEAVGKAIKEAQAAAAAAVTAAAASSSSSSS